MKRCILVKFEAGQIASMLRQDLGTMAQHDGDGLALKETLDEDAPTEANSSKLDKMG